MNVRRDTPSPRLPPFEEDSALSALLTANDLDVYVPLFVRHQVDLHAFLLLHESNLEALGVTHMGPRLKLLALIDRCRADVLSSTANQSSRPAPPADGAPAPGASADHARGDAALAPLVPVSADAPTLDAHYSPPPQTLPVAPPGPALAERAVGLPFERVPVHPVTARAVSGAGSVPAAPVIAVDELELGECIGRGSYGDVFRCGARGAGVRPFPHPTPAAHPAACRVCADMDRPLP